MDKMETVMVNEAKPVSNVGDLSKIDDMNLDIGLKHEEANSGTPSRNEEEIPDEERYEEDIREENIADEERDEEDFRDEETEDEEIADEEREDDKDTTDEERDEEDIVDEDDVINRELWEKSLQSARSSGQPMTLNPPKDRILLSTIIQGGNGSSEGKKVQQILIDFGIQM